MNETDTNKDLFRRLVDEVPNKGNVEVLDEVLADDAVFYNPTMPEPVRGAEGVRAMVEGVRSGFPDLRVEIEDLIAEGDRVVALVTVSGTNTGESPGQAATGKHATWQVVHFLRCTNGRIVEDRQFIDRLSLQEQLG